MQRLAARRPGPAGSHTFDTEGVYNFVCQVHRDTMKGAVTVRTRRRADAAPVPESQKPYANDDATPVALEKVELDEAVPRLTAVSASAARAAGRVRFRVNELSTGTCGSSTAARSSRPCRATRTAWPDCASRA